MKRFVSSIIATAGCIAALAGAHTAVAPAAQAATCSTHACIIDMAPPIYVMNNLWGSVPAGSWQSITSNNSTSWRTDWHYTGSLDWQIHSYASAILGWQWGYRFTNTGFPVQVTNQTKNINTTCAYTYSTGTTAGDVAYDCWYHNTNNPGTSTPSHEVMIWLAEWGGLGDGGPAGDQVTIGGVTWGVTNDWNGSWNLITFRKWGGGTYNVGGKTFNLRDFNNYIVSRGWMTSSTWMDSLQFGTELYNPGDGWLNVSNYTASITNASGCGTPTFSVTGSASPNPVARNSTTNLTLNVKCLTNCLSNGIIDLEVYNSSGAKVAQNAWTGQTWSTGQTLTRTWGWSTGTAGTYTVKCGVFNSTWATLYHWNNGVYNFTVN